MTRENTNVIAEAALFLKTNASYRHSILHCSGGESYYPDSDTDSFFTDSTFSSGDDLSEEGEAGTTAEAHWRPSVYFHGYLLIRVSTKAAVLHQVEMES